MLEAMPLGHVASRDGRGAVRLVLSGTDEAAPALPVRAEIAARLHLARHAALFGWSEAMVRALEVARVHDIAGGANVVQFVQRAKGVEVLGARASVVLDASRNLVSIASNLSGDAETVAGTRALEFPLSPASMLPMTAAARATPKRVLAAAGAKLVPAYYVETLERSAFTGEEEGFAYTLDARDGSVLRKVSLTASDSYRYRVWASRDGQHVPLSSPWTPPALVTMEGFNTNPQRKPDPWLAVGATTTFGNNVHAYADRNDRHANKDGSKGPGSGYEPGLDLVADVTSPRTFDRVFDVTQSPDESEDQIKAAITQLFYVTNWLHDYWYDSGFDEASGVAQVSNYGRGGKEGDPILAEAQDGADFGKTDNARMTTFADGTSPRLEMHLWRSGYFGHGPTRDTSIDSTVIAHEWGHYLHHRLVPCSTPSCLGMSEGWGDFTALMMVLDERDLESGALEEGSFAIGQYTMTSVVRDAQYFGVRRAPYSTNPAMYPFTFADVRRSSTLPTDTLLAPGPDDMSEAHNVGEIWTEALFEGFVGLAKAGKASGRSFEATKHAMADYIVAGLKATPPEPTFTEQRDALLAVVRASGRRADFDALARGFAKRGFGLHAIAPDASSEALDEAVANFERAGTPTFLDAHPAGRTTLLRFRNIGWTDLPATTMTLRSRGSDVTQTIPAMSPYGVATLVIEGPNAPPDAIFELAPRQ
ncbi:M36 family metallopeptidase [Pendulispora brunnea]|uniref:M36 family metallopeptidase n=1 Tax=Pendulispora brunnea TaxID=2905690 RepID=A0ABZ2KJN2_9BACT